MSELLNDAIGVYHRIFDFSGVRIPFSSFLLALIKYYKKSSFFLIDRRAILDYMSWRHLDSAINDSNPPAGSFNIEDTSAEVQEEPHHIRPTLQRLPFYFTPPAAVDVVVLDPTSEELVAGNPSAKIPLVTPIHSATVIPSSGNQGGGSAAPAAKGPKAQGQGYYDRCRCCIVCWCQPTTDFIRPTSSFRDISRDAIHRDFFPFSHGPYYATYPEGGVAGNCKFSREEWDAPHQPTLTILTKEVFKDPSVCQTVVEQFMTPGEMVLIEALSFNQLTAKMIVLHCLKMSHSGELLAWYRGLLQPHHKQLAGLNDKLSSSNVAFSKSKAKGKERKKMIKSLTKSLNNLHAEVARLSTDIKTVATGELLSLAASAGFECGLSMHRTKEEFAAIFEHAAEPLYVVLQLEPEKLACPANIPALKDVRVSPHVVKESTVTPTSASLELLSNTIPTSSAAAL
ncbi:hypothetical protein Tco_1117113 [Tanacetum coccineum]